MKANAMEITGTLDEVNEISFNYRKEYPSYRFRSMTRRLKLKNWRFVWIYKITLIEWPAYVNCL